MTKARPVTGSAAARATRIAGNLLVATVMLLSLAFVLPSLLGYERYVITGGSMSGTFEVGSIAFEKTVPVGTLRVGDVITYLPPADAGVDHLVTHRIVSIDTAAGRSGAPLLRTKGDANADVDPWTFQLYASTQPRLEFTVPWAGYLFIALADRSLRILLIGFPAGLFALYSLVQLVRALREPGAGTDREGRDVTDAPTDAVSHAPDDRISEHA